ncbi:MAG: hypothetical protein DLM72_17825 [Candidatus Nitrosopolaris wilkensis]|nr:MAG: hypothetical protein DLM72_17825 [Candidatus Nitrosopolaris wilkensis]
MQWHVDYLYRFKKNQKEITEGKCACRYKEDVVVRECRECGHLGLYQVYKDNTNLTIICKHEHFLKDHEKENTFGVG